jgi:hypothetical protein
VLAPHTFMHRTVLLFLISAISLAQSTSRPSATSSGKTIVLDATPKTVAFGYYDAAARPVLQIHSGDTVEFDTVITNSPEGLEKAGVAPDQVEKKLRDIFREVTNRGPGGHVLNGPVSSRRLILEERKNLAIVTRRVYGKLSSRSPLWIQQKKLQRSGLSTVDTIASASDPIKMADCYLDYAQNPA